MTIKHGILISQADPWRFGCPECDAYMSQIDRRVGSDAVSTVHGPRKDPDAQYYCTDCQTPLRHLYDRRNDDRVHVGTCNRTSPEDKKNRNA